MNNRKKKKRGTGGIPCQNLNRKPHSALRSQINVLSHLILGRPFPLLFLFFPLRMIGRSKQLARKGIRIITQLYDHQFLHLH